MRLYKIITVGFALAFPASVFAATMDNYMQKCKAMYPIPDNTINFVEEKTGHDPRQFLIRRCINNERQKMRRQQQVERQQIRAASRYDRSAAQIQQLRTENENYIQDAIRRQTVKRSRFRSRTNVLNPEIFYEGRRSRRSIVREEEGLDRINAIRRNLRRSNLPDPCTSVGAIRQYNNPCKDYGSRAGNVR